ncbi:hypothetical protein GCM10008066_03800 [Oxalicibacterium faecigallinarum]|uniref:Uncharacterized protein n=2 Tax=Oxalicibacterium faecigallinarum TaxID=573741 RepID=A0A8J3ATQ9_9BURK|nr:hypothetical protein GCM10008066_03800 [Oxalicibacterium faecigallinarum]
MNKAKLKEEPTSSFVKDRNYKVLAKYWDDNATKQTIDFKGASFMTIWESDQIAEITIGNGPYYGMIELRALSDTSTKVTTFERGTLSSRIQEWADLIKNAP